MSTLQILNQLGATTKKTEKLQILRDNADNQELRDTLYMALSPRVRFFIRKWTDIIVPGPAEFIPLSAALVMITAVSTRKYTGHEAISYIARLIASLNEDDAQVLVRVIEKDLRAGVAEGLVNEVFPGLIETWPVLLASPFKQKDFDKLMAEGSVYVQEKSDGVRINIVVDEEGGVSAWTRNGSQVDTLGAFDHLGKIPALFGKVLDGELLAGDPITGIPLDRKTGNGLVNIAIKGSSKLTREVTDQFFVNLWDVIPISDFNARQGTETYETRMNNLKTIVGHGVQRLFVLPTYEVKTKEEVYEIYARMRAAGKEGVIVKSKKPTWEDSRPKTQIKLKAEHPSTLRVTGLYEGEGKYEGMLGGIIAETECGGLTVRVGSGFDDAERQKGAVNVGDLVQVKFNEVITNKKNNQPTLFLPIFCGVRHDVSVADTLTDLKNKK